MGWEGGLGHSSRASLPKNTWLLPTSESTVWPTPGRAGSSLRLYLRKLNTVPRLNPVQAPLSAKQHVCLVQFPRQPHSI